MVAVIILVALFSGFTAVRVILGIGIVLVLPFYLILRNFSIDKDECFVFSVFLGLGFFPILAYFVGRVFGSVRLSIGLTFFLLLAIAAFLHVRRKC
jgi:hypothetical protein